MENPKAGTQPALILTLAGTYERFRAEGFNIPKYLLPYGRGTILSCILESFEDFDLFLVCNKRDAAYEPVIRAICRDDFGESKASILWVDDTAGQAQTAKMAIEHFKLHECPVAIHNGDTIVEPMNGLSVVNVLLRKEVVALVDTFTSQNPAYSYALIEDGKIRLIAEKQVVSKSACTGFYMFRKGQEYLDYCAGRDVYITEVLSRMIFDGKAACPIPSIGFGPIVMGTPAEYMNAIRELSIQ